METTHNNCVVGYFPPKKPWTVSKNIRENKTDELLWGQLKEKEYKKRLSEIFNFTLRI